MLNSIQKIACAGFALMLPFVQSEGQTAKSEVFPKGIKHVVVIGVDGLSPDGIRKAKTPVMDSLVANGSVKWKVRAVLPSASSQNWASMIMGAGPEVHGVLNNDWKIDDHTLPPIIQEKDGRFPTIYSVLKAQKPAAKIGVVYHWSDYGRLFQKNAVSFDKSCPDEDSTARVFSRYLVDAKPDLALVHFDHVDHAGHHDGHGTAEYYRSVSKADSLIGMVMNALRRAGMAKSTMVMIVADHGGIGYGHGGATVEEAETALIISGAGIKKGYEIQQPVYVYDYAATMAFALGVVPPYAWTGRPVKAAFSGYSEPANDWKGIKLINAPVIYPEPKLFAKAGGLYVDKPAEIKIAADQGIEIRYTLNGADPEQSDALYTKPIQITSTTVVKAKAFDKSGNLSPVASAYFRLVSSGNGNGLETSFYRIPSSRKLPIFDQLKVEATWEDWEVSTNFSKISPLIDGHSGTFALVQKGYIQIEKEGKYTFYTQSDDGSKLFIGDKEVVNNDGDHGVQEESGSIVLKPGKHPIRVEYFNNGGSGWLEAFIKGPGVSKQPIPAGQLFLKN